MNIVNRVYEIKSLTPSEIRTNKTDYKRRKDLVFLNIWSPLQISNAENKYTEQQGEKGCVKHYK